MIDTAKLEVGSIIWWEEHKMLWRIEGVCVSVIDARRIREHDKVVNWLFSNLSHADDLFKSGVLYACPRRAAGLVD